MGGLMRVAGSLRASLTAHHSPTLNAPGSPIRGCGCDSCDSNAKGLVCAGGARESQCRRAERTTSFDDESTVERASSPSARLREEQVVEDEERGNSASALRTCMLKQRACATVGRGFDAIDSNAVDRTVRFTLAGDCDEDRPSTARAAGLQRPGRNSRHRSGRADWHQQLTTTWRGDDCSRSASSSCSAH